MSASTATPDIMTTNNPEAPTLTKKDRCDAKGCPAQAFVIVQFVTGSLYFCSHHFNEHETGLFDTAVNIIDERDQINDHSESSA